MAEEAAVALRAGEDGSRELGCAFTVDFGALKRKPTALAPLQVLTLQTTLGRSGRARCCPRLLITRSWQRSPRGPWRPGMWESVKAVWTS